MEWLVGDKVRGTGPSFPLGEAGVRKKDAVQARVTVRGAVFFSDTVVVGNAPPAIRVLRFAPSSDRPGEPLALSVEAHDPDGDPVSFRYAWEVNGVPAGSGSRLEGILKRGDVVTVTVTPSDGEAAGKPVTVRQEVRNMPPSIAGAEEMVLSGDTLTLRVKAADPDGDPLTFSLAAAPPGMTIGETTGRLLWRAPPGFSGSTPVTVKVSDGQGGEAIWSFKVTISQGRVSAAPERP